MYLFTIFCIYLVYLLIWLFAALFLYWLICQFVHFCNHNCETLAKLMLRPEQKEEGPVLCLETVD